MSHRPRLWLPGVLLVAALLRLAAIPLAHNLGLISDEREYLFLAARLQQGGPFVDSNGDASVRSPLFPLLLSFVPHIAADNLMIPLVVESVLGVLAVFLVYRLALGMWDNERAALVAAGAAALHPGLVVYSALLMTEMPFVVLFLSMLLVIRRFVRGPRLAEALLIGVLAGLAALVRGVFVVPFCLLMILLWRSLRNSEFSAFRSAAFAVVPLLACAAMLMPWTIRNYEVHHALVPMSTFTGVSLVYGNNPYTHGSTKFDTGFDAWYREQRRERGLTDPDTAREVDRMRVDRQIALDYMRTHPWDTVKHMVQKAYVFSIYPLSHQQPNTRLKLLMIAADLLLYLGAALAAGVAWHLRKQFAWLWVPIAGFLFVHIVLHAEARYRIPVVPLVCVFFGGTGMVLQNRGPLMKDRVALRIVSVLAGAVAGVYLLTAVLWLRGGV